LIVFHIGFDPKFEALIQKKDQKNQEDNKKVLLFAHPRPKDKKSKKNAYDNI